MDAKNGFTFVELIVVVLILGILTAIAAPKLLNMSATATDNGLRQTLHVVRDAIDLSSSKSNRRSIHKLDYSWNVVFLSTCCELTGLSAHAKKTGFYVC